MAAFPPPKREETKPKISHQKDELLRQIIRLYFGFLCLKNLLKSIANSMLYMLYGGGLLQPRKRSCLEASQQQLADRLRQTQLDKLG